MGLHTSKHKWGKVSFCRSWTIMDHRDAADYLTIPVTDNSHEALERTSRTYNVRTYVGPSVMTVDVDMIPSSLVCHI